MLISLGLLVGAVVGGGAALAVGGGAAGTAAGGSDEGGAESVWTEAGLPEATVRFLLAGRGSILMDAVSSVSSSSVRSDEARSGMDLADEGAVAVAGAVATAAAGTEVSRGDAVVLLREREPAAAAVVGVAVTVVGG